MGDVECFFHQEFAGLQEVDPQDIEQPLFL